MAKWFAKTVSALTAGLCLLGAVELPSVIPTAQVYAADYQQKGDIDGFYYECWNQNSAGEYEYENTENNGFFFSWNGIVDAFALKGDLFERNTVFATQIKDYTVTYDADVDYMDNISYSGVYGWMEKPYALMEFYIIDSWGSWRPRSDEELGSFESNGITYDIYKVNKNQMNLMSSQYSYAYYSVARENLAEKTDGTCNVKNTINVVDHFKAWSEAGLELGYMYDVGFSVQAYRSEGQAKLNSLEISKEITDKANYGPDFMFDKHDPLTADEEGRTVFVDFETDSDKVGAAGKNAVASYDTEHSYSGERSILISGDDKNRRSFEYKIDPYDFSSNDLIAGLKLRHNGSKDVKFIFEIADLDSVSGVTDERFSRTISPGLWADMEFLQFSLSSDKFKRFSLRITASEPVDFYVDDFYIGTVEDLAEKLAKKDHPIRGDVNGDNIVDIYDVVTVRRALLATDGYNVNVYQDVNGDCKLNISDLVMLTQFVLGKTEQIPAPDTDFVYRADNFYEYVGEASFNAMSTNKTVGEIKTALRSDGTYVTQWFGKTNYELEKSQQLKDLDSLSVKYSGTAKTEAIADSGQRSYILMKVTASFVSGDDEVVFIINDGADEEDRLRWLLAFDDMELVNIGGTEYYVDKMTEPMEEIDPGKFIWIYPKESSFEAGKLCSFEREIDFSEILKYYGKEDYKPSGVSCSLVSSESSGFAEVNEMSFIGSSK